MIGKTVFAVFTQEKENNNNICYFKAWLMSPLSIIHTGPRLHVVKIPNAVKRPFIFISIVFIFRQRKKIERTKYMREAFVM